ncbi:Alpha/Beta hydrolase protein [Dimargaris cristalligena]|uniref:Alpha/Beta hydrolase protein n=1 Tax=Dimargaris cristalligena TaxID=215637 RepID=A0A4V1J470_9FUNG|nr:Alpha/Beta hydrolase protein [Dimargaris cristalligena]|eukprot:RKP34529.1 Alpha/Beta hydrolase protein [Dimargaris cristalligena]
MENRDVLLKGTGTQSAQLEYVFHNAEEPTFNGYIATDPKTKVIAVVFRGSSTTDDLETVLDVKRDSWPVGTGSEIYGGPLSGYQTHGAALVAEHQKLVTKYPDYRSVITGHSLGGLHAMIYAFDNYGKLGPAPWEVITFASPKIGNPEFRQLWRAKDIPVARVANLNDAAIHWPLLSYSFCHTGPPIVIDSESNQTYACADESTPGSPNACLTQKRKMRASLSAHGSFWGNDGSQFGPKA